MQLEKNQIKFSTLNIQKITSNEKINTIKKCNGHLRNFLKRKTKLTTKTKI